MSTSKSYAVAYLRPEIATGYYQFNGPSKHNETDGNGDASNDPTFSGLTSEIGAFLFPNGQIVSHIKQRILKQGLVIEQERMIQLNHPLVRRLFGYEIQQLQDEKKRSDFLAGFTRGPTLVLLLSLQTKEHYNTALNCIHSLIGPQNPIESRQVAISASLLPDQWPLRALCGLNAEQYAIHTSATEECVWRERYALFPPRSSDPSSRLGSAVIVLLPTFLTALPEGLAQITKMCNTHGLIITSSNECSSFSPAQYATLATSELTTFTTTSQRAEFQQLLKSTLMSDRVSLVLRILGQDVPFVIRQLIGPKSILLSRQYFPTSLRSLLPSPFPDLSDHPPTGLGSGVLVIDDPAVVQQLVPEDEKITSTLAIIKPNASHDRSTVASIQRMICDYGFDIVDQRRIRLSATDAATFYHEHSSKPFFHNLTKFMTSNDIIAMHLSRVKAVEIWRALMGPTNSLQAKATHPWTLRARFGQDGTQNATHGSDSAVSAQREITFFFGKSCKEVVPVQTMVKSSLALPYAVHETIETVITKGLGEMMQYEWTNSLDAIQWLGEWLLEQPNASGASLNFATLPKVTAPTHTTTVSPPSSQEKISSCEVFVVLAEEGIASHVKSLVESRGVLFVDVKDYTSLRALYQHVIGSGKCRIVICGLETQEWSEWVHLCTTHVGHVTCVIDLQSQKTFDIQSQTSTHFGPTASYVHYNTQTDNWLQSIRTIFDPMLVIVNDEEKLTDWPSIASQFGFVWLTLDVLVQCMMKTEADVGPFTQYWRTSATIPPSVLVTAILAVIRNPSRLGPDIAGSTNRFMMSDFPWDTINLTELEAGIGSIHVVLQAAAVCPSWSRSLEANGRVLVVTKENVDQQIQATLVPKVTFLVGGMQSMVLEQLVIDQGHQYLNASNIIPVNASSEQAATILHSAFQKGIYSRSVVISDFPRTREDTLVYRKRMGDPRLVLVPKNSDIHDAVTVLLNGPTLISSIPNHPDEIKGLVSHKNLTLVVGDTLGIEIATLRSEWSPIGITIVDGRNVSASQLIDKVRRTFTPRCVIVGVPDNVQALERIFGCALNQVIIVKQRPVQPPSRVRTEEDDYDSEEEEELQRQRLHEMNKLRPELEHLVERYTHTNTKVSIHMFSAISSVYSHLHTMIRPKFIGVVGHPSSCYLDVVQQFSLQHSIPYIDLTISSSKIGQARVDDQLQRLRTIVSSSPRWVFFLDGFPRPTSSTSDFVQEVDREEMEMAPYIAQQVLLLKERMGPLVKIIDFQSCTEMKYEVLEATRLQNNGIIEYSAEHQLEKINISCDGQIHDALETLAQAVKEFY